MPVGRKWLVTSEIKIPLTADTLIKVKNDGSLTKSEQTYRSK